MATPRAVKASRMPTAPTAMAVLARPLVAACLGAPAGVGGVDLMVGDDETVVAALEPPGAVVDGARAATTVTGTSTRSVLPSA